MLGQLVRRAGLPAILVVVAIVGGIVYSKFGGQSRVHIAVTYSDQKNLTVRMLLLDFVNLTEGLNDAAANTSVELGADLGEIIALIERANASAQTMWVRLGEEVMQQYQAILDMIARMTLAWTDPDLFEPEWFENPANADICAKSARTQEVRASEVMPGTVSIRLEANKSLAYVAYSNWWLTSSDAYDVKITGLMARNGSRWVIREFNVTGNPETPS